MHAETRWRRAFARIQIGAIWAAVTGVADRGLSSEALAGQFINDVLAGCREQPRARKSRRHLAPLIPAGHGIAAVATFVLAVTTAIRARCRCRRAG